MVENGQERRRDEDGTAARGRQKRKVAEIEDSSTSSRSCTPTCLSRFSFPLMMESERPGRPGKYRSGGI